MYEGMKALTGHQRAALARFPLEGWHRVDILCTKAACEFGLRTRRAEYTAELLMRKGYLERRIIRPAGTVSAWALYWEYRRVQQ